MLPTGIAFPAAPWHRYSDFGGHPLPDETPPSGVPRPIGGHGFQNHAKGLWKWNLHGDPPAKFARFFTEQARARRRPSSQSPSECRRCGCCLDAAPPAGRVAGIRNSGPLRSGDERTNITHEPANSIRGSPAGHPNSWCASTKREGCRQRLNPHRTDQTDHPSISNRASFRGQTIRDTDPPRATILDRKQGFWRRCQPRSRLAAGS